jgi:SNF2 family DNA or RNA helicase
MESEQGSEKLNQILKQAKIYAGWIATELNAKFHEDEEHKEIPLFDSNACKLFEGKLRDYQITGLNWLIGLNRNGTIVNLLFHLR